MSDEKPDNLDPDVVSNRMFGYPYKHLSSWGKATVDHAIGKIYGLGKPKIDAPHNQTLKHYEGSMLVENERLARLVEDLQIENAELWQELEEMRVAQRADESPFGQGEEFYG